MSDQDRIDNLQVLVMDMMDRIAYLEKCLVAHAEVEQWNTDTYAPGLEIMWGTDEDPHWSTITDPACVHEGEAAVPHDGGSRPVKISEIYGTTRPY